MTDAVAKGVFISYSRSDSGVVTLAANLLKAGGATVFLDVVDIAYGADWQQVLRDSIGLCERVLVFWSQAAADSKWVTREWKMAAEAGKRIVPILLDATPLPRGLAKFNAMPELRDLVLGQLGAPRAPTPSAPMPAAASAGGRGGRRASVAAGVALVVVAAAGLLVFGWRAGANKVDTSPHTTPGGATSAWIVPILLLLLAAASFAAIRRRGRRAAASREFADTGAPRASPLPSELAARRIVQVLFAD